MSKKEYNLEEFEKYYKDTTEYIAYIKKNVNDEKLIGRCDVALKKLEEQYNEVLFAKPGNVIELENMRIIVK